MSEKSVIALMGLVMHFYSKILLNVQVLDLRTSNLQNIRISLIIKKKKDIRRFPCDTFFCLNNSVSS